MVNIQVGDHTIENIELAIFDKDGTIIELYHYWSKMVYFRALFICKRLGLDNSHIKGLSYAMGVDFDEKKLKPEGPVGLKKREIVMKEAINYLKDLGFNDTENLCIEVFNEVDAYSQNHLGDFIKPIDGAVELLRNLAYYGCKVVIATTDISIRAKIAMEFLGLENCVHLIVGAEMVKRQKPYSDQIEFALNVFNCKKDNAIMVGDALIDVEMGINAGLKGSIGLLTGFGTYDEFIRITPYVVNDISQIKVKKVSYEK
ncbi:MAG: HAD hydrolase-like protein [Syntrophorhabdaceae bacterium]|nr:HAD hydrolase-like protein [Syntrophorhabdaceae bacterium]